MKRRFSVVYILAGCAFVWLLWVDVGSESLMLFAGGMALLCFFTAWQGWFNGGVMWKILHTAFGLVTVGLCLAAWGYVVPYLTGRSQSSGIGIGEWLAAAAALLLTPPAVAYVVTAIMWLRSRRKVARAQTAGDTAVASAPPVARIDPAPTVAAAQIQERFGRRTTVGVILAALGVAAVIAWMRYGNDVRCEFGGDAACYTVAASAALRGDLDVAVAIYDEVIPRQRKRGYPSSTQVSSAWGARNAILIRQDTFARLDAIALEACPQRPVECRDLIQALDKAGQRARAEAIFRRYCENGGGEACSTFGKWLIEKGDKTVGFVVLQSNCDSANVVACLEYGTQLAQEKRFDEARVALKRSCVLQAEAQLKGKQPTIYATCQAYMNNEKAFVTREQLRDDAREICLAYLAQCADVAGVIAYDPKYPNPEAAEQMVEESCAMNRGSVPSINARICDAKEPYVRRVR